MLYCPGKGHELLSASTVFPVCHDSSVFLMRLLPLSGYLSIVKVDGEIKSPGISRYIGAFSKLFSISEMFFSPKACTKRSFGLADVAPGTRRTRHVVNDIALVVDPRSKLGNREFELLL